MELNRETMPYLLVASLIGTGGGTGVSQLINQHDHPEIIREIREVQYDAEIEKLTVRLETIDKNSASYKVAEAQLVKFTQMKIGLRDDSN